MICVIGGGISGLVFAALYRQAGGEVVVLEQNNSDKEDGKSVVISAASARILKSVGVNFDEAVPVSQIQVLFPPCQDFLGLRIDGGDGIGSDMLAGNSVLRGLQKEHEEPTKNYAEEDSEDNQKGNGDNCSESNVLGYGISHRQVRRQLIEQLGDCYRAPCTVLDMTTDDEGVQVRYRAPQSAETPQCITAQAAIIACELPQLPPPFLARVIDCRQAVLSLAARGDNFPPDLAVESFTKLGLVALVPRTDAEKPVGIIVCASAASLAKIAAEEDAPLMDKINQIFKGRFNLHSPSARFIYAPHLRYARPLSAGRIALLGAGATTLHPAGAQGFNMGLADAECLATMLEKNNAASSHQKPHKNENAGQDIESIFAAYSRRRVWQHRALLAATGLLGAGGHLRPMPFRIVGGMAATALHYGARAINRLTRGAQSKNQNQFKTQTQNQNQNQADQ